MSNQAFLTQFRPYPNSIHEVDGSTVFVSAEQKQDVLIILGGDLGFAGDDCKSDHILYRRAEFSHVNAENLRRLFPFTAPRQGLASARSFGVGDRLGLACPGHILAFSQYDAFPIFAQQSIRELTLTGRSYEEVLDCVSFAVFRAGFKRGFGADGDHLKKPEEIEYALSCGYSMITLDCSEHIRNDVAEMTDEQIDQNIIDNPELEKRYLNQSFAINSEISLTFTRSEFRRMLLIYGQAINFASDIFDKYIKDRSIDFEISIDETSTPTTPLQHYFVANELNRLGVRFATLAPRFCGEFQKGVDYIGDLKQFEHEFAVHAAIAEHFGYKISVHSGSDKFSVFPIVGCLSKGHFHLKTAGTNWLEAVKLVAIKDPQLYRELHIFALKTFSEAQKYYHVTTNLERIPAIESMTDGQLPDLFDLNDARQVIHITYGLILTAKNSDGTFRFRTRLYDFW
ncbi:MAG TPA: hypothetical protein DCM45_01300, partial [Clostridiales bacterium]|nr:hypothetical protein [Clostridiales bacterium]